MKSSLQRVLVQVLFAGLTTGLICALTPDLNLAHAQELSEVQLDKSAASDLYVKKRPSAPEGPRLPKILQKRLLKIEKKVDQKRNEAIGLLKEFLASGPTGDGRAEGLFKLAELLWEDARRIYLIWLDKFDRKLESCSVN
jgi:hypothetical protein